MLSALLITLALALLAPLLSHSIPRVIIPVAVIEVLLGILAGPQVFDVLHVNSLVSDLATLGVVFLFFLAGLEIDFDRIAGAPLRTAAVGWIVSFGLAVLLGIALASAGLDAHALPLALAISTTALGTLLPILGDAGHGGTSLGKYVMAAGAVGEFVPIVLLAMLLNPHSKPLSSVLALNVFVVLVVIGVLAARHWNPSRLARIVGETMHSSGQVAVRVSLVLIVSAAAVAAAFGLDNLLGAFAAGVIVSQVLKRVESPERERILIAKYEAVGFGFLIPIYFVATGARFDLDALLSSPWLFALMAGFVLAFLILRGVPTALLARRAGLAGSPLPLALLTATQLPLVINITAEAVEDGEMSGAIAAALVGAAMLTVLVFPTVALSRASRSNSATLLHP